MNEPVASYAPGSPERDEILLELARQSQTPMELPLWLGGSRRFAGKREAVRAPHRHSLILGYAVQATAREVEQAILFALEARASWSRTPLAERARIFLKAAELLSGPFRARMNAATMLGQSKTIYQSEIDAVAELVDFLRFNVKFALELEGQPLVSPKPTLNWLEMRPLEGFVYAVSPFNFTSIAANLPMAPVLMGNTVVWKPSGLAPLSAHYIMELLSAAGLPDGVVNLVQGDPIEISRQVLGHPSFAGLHFTGGTSAFGSLWQQVGQNLDRYTSFPRIVGETGGKDFIFAHPSADREALAVAIVRGAFEYQGQKCSAASRIYLPQSIAMDVKRRVVEMMSEIRMGDIADFKNFMGAVIGRGAFDRITQYQRLAQGDPACQVLSGGTADDSEGYFVQPTLIETQDPRHALMCEEIFGPVATLWVYADDRFREALEICDQTSPYALTGAIFAQDRAAITEASEVLRYSAGNFYINDKPTGAVVGQQPFGGGRRSGTNDKAGSFLNLVRWVSPRAIKENFCPPTDWRYPFMA
ncbi:MAG: L-glutamate gamma-semialdehyde dehydrogenase [Polyangiaceae bacterium]|nr:L-glutamate gamma-semialdehyde dehydrogenase [Polyangiaceae bacterium]